MGLTKNGSESTLWLVEFVGKHSSNIWNLVPLCICGVFRRSAFGKLLRTWIALEIIYLLLLTDFFSIGLGLGDSNLVILSLRSFVLSSFIIIFLLGFLLFFVSFFSLYFCFALCFSCIK